MNPTASVLFAGEHRVEAIAPANRGLNYGDGLFETMRVAHGTLPLWPRHLARLREGADRLGMALPDAGFVEARIAEQIDGIEAGVLKLLLTRGDGGRGYAPALDAAPVWALSLHPLPVHPTNGLCLQWCETRLARQPLLAGIKHCNRLEQVLARAEIERAGCDEGLLRDTAGKVVSATAANLLVLRGGRWQTPELVDCGVAGVLRGWLLAQGLVDVVTPTLTDVESADALALCNAVRGILPVSQLAGRTWAASPALTELQERLAMAYPMFNGPMVRA